MKLATVTLARTMLTIVLLSGALANGPVQAGEEVTVHLRDGKKLTAEVDTRTDDTRLWLRFGQGSLVILRPLAWEHIAQAEHAGTTIDHAAVKALASERDEAAERADAKPAGDADPIAETHRTHAEQARRLLDFHHPVRAVDFDARLANWDGDVEYDGIVLQLFPLDEFGQPTTVRGTLNVELFARRKVAFSDVPDSRGYTTQQLGRWTVAVSPAQAAAGKLIKLPFRNQHPEFDTTWASHGLVHVRLVVPGHGVFEHSFDGLRVRPYSPLRDRRQLQGESRFLPTERISRPQVSRD